MNAGRRPAAGLAKPRAGLRSRSWPWCVLLAWLAGCPGCSRVGFESRSGPVPTSPPSVSILAPANGSYVKGRVGTTISASASDDAGVAEVELLVDGDSIGKRASAPYEVSWTPPCTTAGRPYRLEAIARNTWGTSATSSPVVVSTLDQDGDQQIDGCEVCDVEGSLIPDPFTLDEAVTFRIANLQLDSGGNVLSAVPPGSQIAVSSEHFLCNTDACPTCVDQLYYGYASIDNASRVQLQCATSVVPVAPAGSSGTSHFVFAAPAQPGTYYLVMNWSWDYYCNQGTPNYTWYQGVRNVVGAFCVQ